MGTSLIDSLPKEKDLYNSVLNSLPSESNISNGGDNRNILSYLNDVTHKFIYTGFANSYNQNDPVGMAIGNMLFRNSPNERAIIQQTREQLARAQNTGLPALDRAVSDLGNIFGKFGDSVQKVTSGNGTPSFVDVITGLPRALSTIVTSPLEAATGMDITSDAPIATAMTPEQRAEKIKQTAGLILSYGVGKLASAGFDAYMGARAGVLGTATDDVLAGSKALRQDLSTIDLSKQPTIGILGTNILKASKGIVEGGLAGATYGAVSSANNENQLSNILIAIPFAGIGAFAEILNRSDPLSIANKVRGDIENSRTFSRQAAGNLFINRLVQFDPENSSLFSTLKTVEPFATSDSKYQAIVQGQFDIGNSHVIIPNVSNAIIDKFIIEPDLGTTNIGSWFRDNKDGTSDVLTAGHNEFTTNDIDGWKKTGFLPNEIVTWNGKPYKIDSHYGYFVSPNETQLLDLTTQKETFVPFSELRRLSTVSLDNSNFQFKTSLSLKGKLLASKNAHLYDMQNEQSLQNAEFGKGASFIGFRQVRGENIPNTGRFNGLTFSHAARYSGPLKMGESSFGGAPINSLNISRLNFNKLFVVNGAHNELVDIVRENIKFNTNSNVLPSDIFTPTEQKAIIEAGRITYNIDVGTPENFKISAEKFQNAYAEYGRQQLAPNGLNYYYANSGIPSFKDWAIQNNLIPKGTSYNDWENNYNEYSGKIYSTGKTHPESGYQLIDKIVKRGLTRAGYDGLLYSGENDIGSAQLVDLRNFPSWGELSKNNKYFEQARVANELNTSNFIDNLYNQFKQSWDVSKNISFNSLVENYAKSKGFLDSEVENLKRVFTDKLYKEELPNIQDEGLRNRIATLQKVLPDYKQIDENKTLDNISQLEHNLVSNSMYAEQHEGSIVIKDIDTGRELGRTQTVEDANKFINNSGQANGIDLDGGSPIPPRNPFPSSGAPLNPKPLELIDLANHTRMGDLVSTFHSVSPRFTRMREVFSAFDNKFGTELLAKVFDNTQPRRIKVGAEALPFIEDYLKPVDDILNNGNYTQEEKNDVGHYMQMMTSKEFEKRGKSGGLPIDELEKAFGNQLAKTNISNVFKYDRQSRWINQNIKGIGKQKAALTDLLNSFGMVTDEEKSNFQTAQQALRMFRKIPRDTSEIGVASRYGRILQDEANGLITDKNEFAARYLDSGQLKAARILQNFYKEAGNRFGIGPDEMLPQFMTHARLYNEGDIKSALGDYTSPQAVKDFYGSLARTGEIDSYELDPLKAGRRYLMAGMNNLYLDSHINDAKASLNEELAKIPSNAQSEVSRVVNRYLTDVRSIPDAANKFTDTSIKLFLDRLGINSSGFNMKNIVDSVLATSTAATQGFRVVQALRHLVTGTRDLYVRFNAERVQRILELGSNWDNVEALRQQGIINSFNPLNPTISLEESMGQVGKGISAIGSKIGEFNRFSTKLSGLPAIYEVLQGGAYLESIEKSASVLTDLVDEKYGKLNAPESFEDAYKDLHLSSYDNPVQIQFDKLVQSGKYQDAGEFLARQTMHEVIGVFSSGTSPYGWTSNIGRIAGQFGNWATNHRDFILRSLSQGSKEERIARAMKLAVSDAAFTYLAAKTGINFYTWTNMAGSFFEGGPAMQAGLTVFHAMFGKGPEQITAQEELKKFLPYDPNTGNFNIPQLYIPGSYFANQLSKAYEMSKTADIPYATLEALGFSIENDHSNTGFVENKMRELLPPN